MDRSRSPRRSTPVVGRENYLFVGNPGSGKSTIINGIVGEPVFKSGVSLTGEGVTSNLDTKDVPGWGLLMDTPGLADDQKKEAAAQAITAALKQDGYYRIFFVLTEEKGRIRPADKATMKLVLDAAPITSYGIVVNMVNKKWLRKLNAQENGPAEWFTTLLTGLPVQTSTIYFNPYNEDLDCEENVNYDIDEALRNFITTAPGMNIKKEDVKTVEPDQMTAITKEMEDRIQAFEQDALVKAQMLEDTQKEVAKANRRARQNAEWYEWEQKKMLKQIENANTTSAAQQKEAADLRARIQKFENAQQEMESQRTKNEEAIREAAERDKAQALSDQKAELTKENENKNQKNDGPDWGRIALGVASLGLSEIFR